MSHRPSPPTPRWTIPDLIDLEYLLDRDSSQAGPEFFEENVEPWIDSARIDRPDGGIMSAALWEWLRLRRLHAADSQLPGRAFSGAHTLVGLLLTLGMFANAIALVFGLLRYDGRTFNLLVLLAATLGLSWLLLLAALAGYLSWGLWRHSPFLSLAQNAVFQITDRLMRRPLGQDAARWWRETARTRRLFAFPALALTQKAALSYLTGAICGLLLAVYFLSIRFGWETTAAETMSPFLHRVATVLGKPWSWFRPAWVPTLQVIEQSRISWEQTGPRLPSSGLAGVWIPFLTLTLLVWGVVPRLLLLLWIQGKQRRALRNYSFQDRVHREWWRKLTDFQVEIPVSGPADGAFAILWAGASIPTDDLRAAALRQLRLNIERHGEAGVGSGDDDEACLDQLRNYLRQEPGARLVVVAESWALAPKDLAAFLDRVRQVAGDATGIDLFLTGLPQGGRTLTAPPAGEIAIWEDFAARRNDSSLYVRPYRADLVPASP